MDILYILLVIGIIILMGVLVAIKAIFTSINKRTNQAILLGVGYYLLERRKK